MNARRLPPPVLALSPGTLTDLEQGKAFLQRLMRARAGGLRGVLLREPGLGDRDTLDLLVAMRQALDEVEGWLGLHDRIHLARVSRVDGVHVGRRSLSVSSARGQLPAGVTLGYSAHAADSAKKRTGADYLLLAPLRELPGKGPALGLEGLCAEVRGSDQPVWALGGVTPEDGPALHACGARGIALLRGILGAQDPEQAARHALGLWPDPA